MDYKMLLVPITAATAVTLSAHVRNGVEEDSVFALQNPAEAVIKRARQQVGTAQLTIASFTATGTILEGFNGITGRPLDRPKEIDLRALLPSHYLRIVRSTGTASHEGFVGDRSFFLVQPLNELTSVSGPTRPRDMGKDVLSAHRTYLALLLLGMFVETDAVTSLVPRAPSPATAETVVLIDATARQSYQLEMDDGIPIRIRYLDDVSFPQPLTEADRRAGRMPGPPRVERVEVSIDFSDRRSVDGIRAAHVIRRTAKDVRLEELRFERVQINPPLTTDDFRLPRLLFAQGRSW